MILIEESCKIYLDEMKMSRELGFDKSLAAQSCAGQSSTLRTLTRLVTTIVAGSQLAASVITSTGPHSH